MDQRLAAAAAASMASSSNSSVAQFNVVSTLSGTNSGDGTLSGTIHLRLQALTFVQMLLAQSWQNQASCWQQDSIELYKVSVPVRCDATQ